MATLTNDDYGEIRQQVYQTGVCKQELKALARLPNKAELMAAFQSMENDMTGAFPTIKANVEAALGVTITSPLAQKLFASYLKWKIKQLGL